MNSKTEAGGYIFTGAMGLGIVSLILFFIYQNTHLVSPEEFSNFVSPFSSDIYNKSNYTEWNIPLVFELRITALTGELEVGGVLYSNNDLIDAMVNFDSTYTGNGIWDFYNPFAENTDDIFDQDKFDELLSTNDAFKSAMIQWSDVINDCLGSNPSNLFTFIIPDFIDHFNTTTVGLLNPIATTGTSSDFALEISSLNTFTYPGITDPVSITPIDVELTPIPFWDWILYGEGLGSTESSTIRKTRLWILLVMTLALILSAMSAAYKVYGLSLANMIVVIAVSYYLVNKLATYGEMTGSTEQILAQGGMFPARNTLNQISNIFLDYWKWVLYAMAGSSVAITAWGLKLAD